MQQDLHGWWEIVRDYSKLSDLSGISQEEDNKIG